MTTRKSGNVKDTLLVKKRHQHFEVGLAEPDANGVIERRFHLDEGLYLSAKGRICSHRSAASFDSREEAVAFFADWVKKKPERTRYKLEVIDYTTLQIVEVQLFDDTHPLWAIEAEAPTNIAKAGREYFFGYLHETGYSRSTIARYRKGLLGYGVDIAEPVAEDLDLAERARALSEHYAKTEEPATPPSLRPVE